MEDYNINLILQEPIDVNEITINQPTIMDILTLGSGVFNQLIYPFTISIDMLEIEEDEIIKRGIKDFDLIYNNKPILNGLIESIKYFCKCTSVKIEGGKINVDGKYIDRNNFEDFSEIILNICGREKIKPDKPPQFQHEKGTKEWDEGYKKWKQIQENRKKYSKNKELKLEDIVNVIQFGGKSYIPIEEIKKWTMWTLINAYKTILNINSYETNFDIYLISGEKSLVEKHWTELIKINN